MELKLIGVRQTEINEGKTLTDIQNALSQAECAVTDAKEVHKVQKQITTVFAVATGISALLGIIGLACIGGYDKVNETGVELFLAGLLGFSSFGWILNANITNYHMTKHNYIEAQSNYQKILKQANECEAQETPCK